jgi:hypothetical protein
LQAQKLQNELDWESLSYSVPYSSRRLLIIDAIFQFQLDSKRNVKSHEKTVFWFVLTDVNPVIVVAFKDEQGSPKPLLPMTAQEN